MDKYPSFPPPQLGQLRDEFYIVSQTFQRIEFQKLTGITQTLIKGSDIDEISMVVVIYKLVLIIRDIIIEVDSLV